MGWNLESWKITKNLTALLQQKYSSALKYGQADKQFIFIFDDICMNLMASNDSCKQDFF